MRSERDWHDFPHRVVMLAIESTPPSGPLSWCGDGLLQFPTDLLMYHELLWESRTDCVIEIGTAGGTSACFFEDILTLHQIRGRIAQHTVITVDIEDKPPPLENRNIIFVQGHSLCPSTIEKVVSFIPKDARVSVFLDSDHGADHVLSEILAYKSVVSEGCYLVVEDTYLDTRHLNVTPSASYGAVIRFFEQFPDEFKIDARYNRFLMTQNYNGYLKKIAGS